MNYVYWYCPNCGMIYDCFYMQQISCCEKCWGTLKETDVQCLDGLVECSDKRYDDEMIIISRYLQYCISEDKLKVIKDVVGRKLLSTSESTIFEVNYFAPKIETLKRMVANGEEITIDINAERRKCRELYNQQKEIEQITKPSFTDSRPKCPTCGSTNIKKISDLERGVSVGMWGLFSSNVGKTMKCNSCGYKW